MDLDSHVVWDLGSLTETFVDWMKNPEASNTSKFGTLLSQRFWNLIDISIHEDIKKEFQALFSLQSAAYIIDTPKDEHRKLGLSRMAAIAGHQCMKALDELLEPQALASTSEIGGSKINKLRSLFLILIGTILAVGYTFPIAAFPTLRSCGNAARTEEQAKLDTGTSSSPSPLSGNLYNAMQDHLCRTMAHFAVYIAEKLGLPITLTRKSSFSMGLTLDGIRRANS